MSSVLVDNTIPQVTAKQKMYVEYLLEGSTPAEAVNKAYNTANPFPMASHNQKQPAVLEYLRYCLNKQANTSLGGVATKLSETMEAKKVLADGSISLAPDTTNQLRATELVLRLHGALNDDSSNKTVNNTQLNVLTSIGGDLTGLLGKLDTMTGNLFGDHAQIGDRVEPHNTQVVDI